MITCIMDRIYEESHVSVDMITYKGSYTASDSLCHFLAHWEEYTTGTHSFSFKPFTYKEMYVFPFGESDIRLFLGFQDCSGKPSATFKLIYNPNKVFRGSVNASVFLDRLVMEAEMFRVNTESADIAIDIPVERRMVRLQKDKRKYTLIDTGALTEYLGNHNNGNFVKVYDKQAESKLPYALTRIEYTLKENVKMEEATVYIQYPTQMCIDFDDKANGLTAIDKYHVKMINDSLDPLGALNELKKVSRRYYENIRDYVELGERYTIPMNVIRELCEDIDLRGCV